MAPFFSFGPSNSAMTDTEDPVLQKAIERARVASSLALGCRPKGSSEDALEAHGEAQELARTALEHLGHHRWDEARALAEAAVELDEQHGDGERWREFALLVEEACETALG
jgi:hypothetical protein